MNLLLDAAPDSQVVHGELAVMLSLDDMADRPPHAIGADAALRPTTLALMHGPSFRGDGADQLRGLAAAYATLSVPTAV